MKFTCYIYRCSAKPDMYIYIGEENGFDKIDEKIRKKLGSLDYAMSLELDKDSKLARENPEQIMENIHSQGFHLQLPSEVSVEELLENIAKNQNP